MSVAKGIRFVNHPAGKVKAVAKKAAIKKGTKTARKKKLAKKIVKKVVKKKASKRGAYESIVYKSVDDGFIKTVAEVKDEDLKGDSKGPPKRKRRSE